MNILTKLTYIFKGQPVSSANLNEIQDAILDLQENAVQVTDHATDWRTPYTDAQKQIARDNIGAASATDYVSYVDSLGPGQEAKQLQARQNIGVGTVSTMDFENISTVQFDTKSIRMYSGGAIRLPESAISSDGICKMADGTLIQWGTETATISVTTAWGSWFYGSFPDITFQEAFKARPAISMARVSGQSLLVDGSPNVSSIHNIYVYRPETATNIDVSISWIAFGRWKN